MTTLWPNLYSPFPTGQKTCLILPTMCIWCRWERLTDPRQPTRRTTRVKIVFNRLGSAPIDQHWESQTRVNELIYVMTPRERCVCLLCLHSSLDSCSSSPKPSEEEHWPPPECLPCCSPLLTSLNSFALRQGVPKRQQTHSGERGGYEASLGSCVSRKGAKWRLSVLISVGKRHYLTPDR